MPRRDPDATVVLVRGAAELASWPLPGADRPDLTMVEELARLQLAARRLGCSIRLRGASAELLDLLSFAGLGGVVTALGCLSREVGGEAKGGEQVGVEEVVVPDDPVA